MMIKILYLKIYDYNNEKIVIKNNMIFYINIKILYFIILLYQIFEYNLILNNQI